MAQIPGMARSRLCARPGCPGEVAAWLTYDYSGQRVWLDDRRREAGDEWGLCAGHAGRLRPPQGWAMVDRRVGPVDSVDRRVGPVGRFEPPAALVS